MISENSLLKQFSVFDEKIVSNVHIISVTPTKWFNFRICHVISENSLLGPHYMEASYPAKRVEKRIRSKA